MLSAVTLGAWGTASVTITEVGGAPEVSETSTTPLYVVLGVSPVAEALTVNPFGVVSQVVAAGGGGATWSQFAPGSI